MPTGFRRVDFERKAFHASAKAKLKRLRILQVLKTGKIAVWNRIKFKRKWNIESRVALYRGWGDKSRRA